MHLNFLFTAVYGLHTIVDGKPLWDETRRLNYGIHGWLVMGDQNTVADIEDRVHGTDVLESEVRLQGFSAKNRLK